MKDTLDLDALARWRADPVTFISDVIRDPETGLPFDLLPAEQAFLDHALRLTEDGRLLYPELLYSAPKKSGKTGFAAMIMLTVVLVHGGRHAEGYALANDLEQSTGRVFQAVKRIVEASPILRREAKVTQNRIEFPVTGATISAVASDYAGAAGANPTISVFDELWGYVSERSRRLWDEMVPPPTRKIACRLTVTYAGFSNESELLLELQRRGLAQPQVGPDLHAGDGLLCFWTHSRVAPWQTESWLAEMRRSLRPNAFLRLIENRFVTTESAFVDMPNWDACVLGRPVVQDRTLPVWVGVDASTKHDSTAVVATTFDPEEKQVRLVSHRVFQPSPSDPLDFEATIEVTVREMCGSFDVREVRHDPWQMAAVAQRLTRHGVPIVEFPQTQANLTAASQNLFELVQGRNLIVYPDAGLRRAVSRAVAVETARGWRIAKERQSHKIDVVVALAMSSLASVRGGGAPAYGMLSDVVLERGAHANQQPGYFERYAYAMMQQRRW